METIKLKCCCGAEFQRECNAFINPGSSRDEKGRVFRAEVMADEWIERHRHCAEKATHIDSLVSILTEIVEDCRAYEKCSGKKVTWCERASAVLARCTRAKE